MIFPAILLASTEETKSDTHTQKNKKQNT